MDRHDNSFLYSDCIIPRESHTLEITTPCNLASLDRTLPRTLRATRFDRGKGAATTMATVARPMKIYSIYNIKGGVGKTTSTVNLAYTSASHGTSTLIWDLDPQGATSFYLCHKIGVQGGVKGLLERKVPMHELIRSTGYPNLDLLPSDASYRYFDQFFHEADKPDGCLKKLIKPLRGSHDLLFLDCPPGLSLLTENILRVTDVLLIPLIPTPLSLRSYNKLVHYLSKKKKWKMKVVPFFNMVNRNNSIHRIVANNVRDRHPIFAKQTIPHSNTIEAMGIKRSPLAIYAPDSEENLAITALWREIIERHD
ncbi:MAG: ParA family protein [Magnetococcales bacterium]|nr:ParA family protein [Magnetococcales bacterium]